MINIKDNPTLSFDSLKNLTIKNNLLIHPYWEKTAIGIKDIMGEGNPKLNVFIDTKLKETEWILITEEDVYYSKGDNTK